MKNQAIFTVLSTLLFCVSTLPAQSLSLLTWNVDSDGSDPAVIAQQLKQLSGHTVYAVTEVDKREFERFRSALGENYKSINGTHKENDHLQIIYDASKLQLESWTEIESQGDVKFNREDRALRCPLYAKFKRKDNGKVFQVVTNHLARGNAKFRTQQASGLREWARNQSTPTISIGDFNFDFEFKTRQGNQGFTEFMRDGVWKWIEPEKLIDTNWYDREKDGKDDYPGSMLDFAFVAGAAKDMQWKCTVIVRKGDFPDDEKTSDHRPVLLQRVN